MKTPEQMQERMLEERQRLLDSSRPLSSRQAEDEQGITSLLRDSMGGQMPSNLEAGIMATGEAIQQLNRNLDNAKDLPDVMNAVRGDRKTIAERKDELAGLVGTEDAQKTPDSVLAVMQPFFQILDVVQAQASPGGLQIYQWMNQKVQDECSRRFTNNFYIKVFSPKFIS